MRRTVMRGVLPGLLALVPLVGLVVFTSAFWVDVPFLDQYAVADLLRAQKAGTLSFAHFWSQHNEHRLLFPRLVMFGLARATGWNLAYEGAATLVFALLGFAVLAGHLRGAARRRDSRRLPWTLPVASALVFSLAQWENWLWGFQLQLPLCTLGVVAACALLGSAGPWRLAGAVLAGVVSTYSFGSGILVWPLGAVIIGLRPKPGSRGHAGPALVWLAAGLVASVAYLLGFVSYSRPSLDAIAGPLDVLRFAVVQLGGPASRPSADESFAVGLLGLSAWIALAVAAWRVPREQRAPALPVLALGAFAIAAAVLTGIGRAGPQVVQPTSRYLACTCWLWVAIVTGPALLSLRWSGIATLLASAIVLLGIARAIPQSLAAARAQHALLAELREHVLRGRWDESIRPLNPSNLRAQVDHLIFLRNERLGLFRDFDPARVEPRPATDCGLAAHLEPGAPGRHPALHLAKPSFAGAEFRCLFSLSRHPPTQLPDGRLVPLAMDAVYLESMRPDSPLFGGHQARFDAQGSARVELRFPAGRLPPGARVHYSVHLVDPAAPLAIGTICSAGTLEP